MLSPIRSVEGQEDPLRGFVSVEPYEVRVEALAEIEVWREAWRLEDEAITLSNRQAILDNIATLMESGVVVRAGDSNQPIEYSSRELRFVRRDPELGYVTDERAEIPVSQAVVGATFFSDEEGVEELSVEWLWYAPGQDRVVIEIASRGLPSARYVTPEDPFLFWEQESAPDPPTFLEIPDVETERVNPLRFLLYFAGGFALVAFVTILARRKDSPPWVGTLVVAAIVSGLLGFSVRTTEIAIPDEEGVDTITYRTLRNIYHAFDFRSESEIYDTLARSVTGPLLERVYLEIQQALQLESSGGPRVKVYEIALREAEALPLSGGASEPGEEGVFRVRSNWATVGQVSHWGHTHERTNRYEAVLEFAPVQGRWKLRGLDLENEERVQRVSRNRVEVENPELVPEKESTSEGSEPGGDSEAPPKEP